MECKNWEIISCHIGYPILELIYVLLTWKWNITYLPLVTTRSTVLVSACFMALL
jgi:hypothetical protein